VTHIAATRDLTAILAPAVTPLVQIAAVTLAEVLQVIETTVARLTVPALATGVFKRFKIRKEMAVEERIKFTRSTQVILRTKLDVLRQSVAQVALRKSSYCSPWSLPSSRRSASAAETSANGSSTLTTSRVSKGPS
jgi:hypothetical protein